MKRSALLFAAFKLLLSCLTSVTAMVMAMVTAAVIAGVFTGSCQPSPACRADAGAGCFGACPSESSYCDERSGQWVACVSDEHCGGATPVCSPSLRECIACATNADCSGSSHGPLCDTSTGQCHECSSNRDCVGNMPVCSLETFTCTPCTSDGGCAESAIGPRCDVAAGTCHRCLEHSDCGGATPACLPSTRECVGCVSNAHCASVPEKICDVGTHGCRGCVADAECIEFPGMRRCDENTGLCRRCTPDTEAEACAAHACNPITFRCTQHARGSLAWCAPCEADSECASGFCVDRSADYFTFGRYCLPAVPDAGSVSASYAPYTTLHSGPTANLAMARYLSPPRTVSCEGLSQFGSACVGRPGTATPNDICGNPGFLDGVCLSTSTAQRPRCTFACGPLGYSCAPGAACATSVNNWPLCVPR